LRRWAGRRMSAPSASRRTTFASWRTGCGDAVSLPGHALAPGKVNLCLFLGPVRDDARHELVTVIQPVSLHDGLRFDWGVEVDEVVCPGIEGENLVARALREHRAACSSDRPPVRVTIDKRVPVAAGMGGGSSDAAQALLALGGSPEDPCTRRVAAALGSDVPALLHPDPTLVGGAGEEVSPLGGGSAVGCFVVVPLPESLSTAEVYAEADRLGLQRPAQELRARRDELQAAGDVPLDSVHNDLQDAARSLCPAIDPALEAVAAVCERALVSGSGPTVFGICRDEAQAREAAEALRPRHPQATAVTAA
jgi:4-diphosphocytidyl-2-C-methyl-D-erythritol kinase